MPLLALTALGLALAIGVVGAGGGDVGEVLRYLPVGGVISLAMAVCALLWLRRGRGPLWQQLTVTYAVGVAASLATVMFTVRAMLLSDSDVPLLVLILLFAGVISLGLGISLASAVSQRIGALNAGARALASGDLGARVSVAGSDEIAELAGEFNHMAERLAAAAAERERQEATRRDLVAAVSHDLRTPLASMRAIVEAIADGVVSDPDHVARYLATLRGQIGLVSGLIDDLFELSRIDAGALDLDLQPIPLGDLVSDAIGGLRPQAEAKGVELRGAPAPPALIAHADAQKIGRVLYNLGANAIRHTPAGGSVTFRVTERPGEGGQPEALVEVADTGEGIAGEDLPHVFERFYRSERSRSRATGGAGLGLAIARGIIEAHGGRISLESQRGHGTTVRFTLPSR
jgi:signal transduction histidine kinase